MNIKYIFIFFFTCQSAFCQGEKWIHGKIIVKDATPKGVLIINLVNETETVSDILGEFDIKAKIDDLLIFPSNHLDYQRKIIETEDYNKGSFIIEMTSKVTVLEEVKIIKHPEINALTLGIITKPIKQYTVAERRLRARMGSAKDIVIERKIADLKYLREAYNDDFYIKQLKITPTLVGGFLYYAVEDNNLSAALRSKNKALISFILVKLSVDYNILQKTRNN